MEILLIPACLICLVYSIFQTVQKKKSPFLSLFWIVFFVGITACAASFMAAVRSHYCGEAEWIREREFFFGMFADKLTEPNDLHTAAEYMRSEFVKEQTLFCIQQIVHAFRPKMIVCLSFGGLILLFSVISLWIKRNAANRYYPFLLLFFVLSGDILFDMGVYYRQYASGTDRMLKNFLRCQQESLMEELSVMKTDLSIPEIVRITRKEAVKNGSGYGQRLSGLLQKKNGGGQ